MYYTWPISCSYLAETKDNWSPADDVRTYVSTDSERTDSEHSFLCHFATKCAIRGDKKYSYIDSFDGGRKGASSRDENCLQLNYSLHATLGLTSRWTCLLPKCCYERYSI